MKKFLSIFTILTIAIAAFSQNNSFISQQREYKRVREAFREKQEIVVKNINDNNLKTNGLNVIFVAYKAEAEFEIYAKSKTETRYRRIAKYDICRSSGMLGPKRKEGDGQVPEGFYYINHFNPTSNFYLSLGINYPNSSDKIKSPYPKLGGAIYIHGKCVTIGCLPMTDDKIKEIYLYALYAKDSGQSKIPVYIFPYKMTDVNLKNYGKNYPQWIDFWSNLKKGYDKFESERKELSISVDKQGNYTFK